MQFNTHQNSFGILIPRDNGVVWQHQGGGMACTQLEFEGIFVPQKPPWISHDEHGLVDLVEERRLYAYHQDDSECVLDWDSHGEVMEAMLDEFILDVRELDAEEVPDDYPQRGTSHVWVEVLGRNDRYSPIRTWDAEALFGEKVAILYENVD